MPIGDLSTLTFLFTDIEGSTRLWEQHPVAMKESLARHDALLREAIVACGGCVFKTVGDAFCAVFSSAPEAMAAAIEVQRRLKAELWPSGVALKVRSALHTGSVQERDGDYFGPPLNRVARILSIGNAGQVLVSSVTQELVRDQLPPATSLKDLGECRLKDLIRPERVYQVVAPGLPTAFDPVRSVDAFPNNLPVQLSSFVGREPEMSEVRRLLGSTHMLTLTGAGGVGKTRLSLQAAAELIEKFPDGVWFVELAQLRDDELVPQVICGAVGVREETGQAPLVALTSYLHDKHLLLVLDNCEHLVSACARTVDALLRQCPSLRILASSREPLHIVGETTMRVPSLPMPAPERRESPERLSQYEAVRLFVDRADAVVPGFSVNNHNAPAIAQICHSLDGIPLAIELAAARVRALSPEQIASRLQDRFRLLTGGNRTALPRQQTLRALIDWSYDLLSDKEKVLLRHLGVFVGGWSLDAAEAVGAGNGIEPHEILDLLAFLVDKSLVTADLSGYRSGELRYALLETVRQYAADLLVSSGEQKRARDRHLRYYRELAEAIEPKMDGAEQPRCIARLSRERGNLRAAFEWANQSDDAIEDGLRLAGALFRFWFVRGDISEGRGWCEAMLARAKIGPDAPRSPGEASTGERKRARARAAKGAGGLAYIHGDLSTAYERLRSSLDLATEAADDLTIAIVLALLGLLALSQRDGATAAARAEEALAASHRADSQWGMGLATVVLGEVRRYQGDLTRAGELYEESIEWCRLAGDTWLSSMCKHNLGYLALNDGDIARATGMFTDALSAAQELAYRQLTALCIAGLGAVAISEGRAPRAATLFGAAEALRESVGINLDPTDEADMGQAIDAARSQMEAAAFAQAWAAGRSMPVAKAADYASDNSKRDPNHDTGSSSKST